MVQSQILVQTPEFKPAREGQTVELRCRNGDVSRFNVNWYRVFPRKQRAWVLTHQRTGMIIDTGGFSARLHPSRVTSNNTYIIKLTAVTISESAVYYCCVLGEVCGDGTLLNITCEYAFEYTFYPL
uniref:Ig-like domain-containing protein n=1 Tax=Callorhinchus milii TaxID=7868 RepID=A0A4W3HEV5_CALMI